MISDEILLSFRKPPVVETVLGIQFEPLKDFYNGHLGAFWKHLSASEPSEVWNRLADAPLIPPVFERFVDEETWQQGITFRVTQEVATRLQIRNDDENAMIQLQNGRLHYNWIGHTGHGTAAGKQTYPGYSYVRPRFDKLCDLLEQFRKKEGLSDIRPNQWEVTYVNHIPQGSVWTDPSDWSKLFPGLPGIHQRPSQVRLEALAGAWHFEIPDKQGRLHVELKHARMRDQKSLMVLRLTLTARGPINVNDDDACWRKCLDLGHRVAVQTFKEITSPEAHKLWELE